MKKILTLVILAAACSSGTPATPTAGAITVQLAGATGHEGAVVLVVSGGPVLSVDAPAGYQVASNADGSGTHIMVMGDLVAGAIVTLNVPDVSRTATYVASLVQVSDRSSFGLLDPTQYQLTVVK